VHDQTLLVKMPRSFLVRTISSRQHRVAQGSAEVDRITPDETEQVEYPVMSLSRSTFVDNLPIDFTIKTNEKEEEETVTSGHAISIRGLYSEVFKCL